MLFMLGSTVLASMKDCKNPEEVILAGSIKMKFCEIPAAENVSIGNENGHINEKPVKKVNFKSFQMGQFTVTKEQYNALIFSGFDQNPWPPDTSPYPDTPAENISYKQAKKFIEEMQKLDSSADYRLPTEAEWEYAARAGSTTDNYWGDNNTDDYVFYRKTTDRLKFQIPTFDGLYIYYESVAGKVTSCPNKSKDGVDPGYCANAFGLMHMLGNVWQWTDDHYVENYKTEHIDGNMRVTIKDPKFRVVRGGGYYGAPFETPRNFSRYVRKYGIFPSFRTSARNYIHRNYPYAGPSIHEHIGFRVVRIPKK